MVGSVDDIGVVVPARSLQRFDKPRQLPVHEGHAGQVTPALSPYLFLGERSGLEMLPDFPCPGMIRGLQIGSELRQIAALRIKVPQYLRRVVGEVGMDDVHRQRPRPVQRRRDVRDPVDGRIDAFQVDPEMGFLHAVLGSPFRGPTPDPERTAADLRIAGPHVLPCAPRLTETQVAARRENVRLAHVHGIHVLFREHAAVGGDVRIDAYPAIGVRLYLMDPAARHEGGPAGRAQGRGAVGVPVRDAVFRQAVHGRGLHEGMAVDRRVERIVLVGNEQEDIGQG